ncbi:dTMP kinase [Candidatus Woesearchaeota archaeon]|nr:dTMP kinase [Candidatus Woesearchaeota archaeon]
MRNLFIVIDGMDGSGKGEQIKKLSEYFISKGYNVLKTFEPTNGKYGKRIRKMLREHKDPLSNSEEMLDLYCMDRKEHLRNEIEPFVSEGTNKIVISDRYYHSTMVFQSAQGIPIQKIINMNKDFRKPDITLILDLEAELALERVKKRGNGKEKFEQLGFMEKLRMNFLSLPKILDENIKIIDASKTIGEVFEQIKKEVDKLI